MCQPRLLLVLLLLLLGATGRARRLPGAAAMLSCLDAALAADNAGPDKRGAHALEEDEEDEEEEDVGKRTFPGDGRHQHAWQGKGKSQPSRGKGERRAKVTLSLDVPTNIMNILFNIAKAKNLRAKAAANAHLMAQIGRRK